jgi:hypothetical protein
MSWWKNTGFWIKVSEFVLGLVSAKKADKSDE